MSHTTATTATATMTAPPTIILRNRTGSWTNRSAIEMVAMPMIPTAPHGTLNCIGSTWGTLPSLHVG